MVEKQNLPSVRHGVVNAKLLVLLPDKVAQVEGDLGAATPVSF